jgi:hypothetical protein
MAPVVGQQRDSIAGTTKTIVGPKCNKNVVAAARGNL